jgi:hypothetical protein
MFEILEIMLQLEIMFQMNEGDAKRDALGLLGCPPKSPKFRDASTTQQRFEKLDPSAIGQAPPTSSMLASMGGFQDCHSDLVLRGGLLGDGGDSGKLRLILFVYSYC